MSANSGALKGLDVLIEALGLVRAETGRTPSLVMVGSGADRDLLAAQAQQAGLGDSIEFSPRGPSARRWRGAARLSCHRAPNPCPMWCLNRRALPFP